MDLSQAECGQLAFIATPSPCRAHHWQTLNDKLDVLWQIDTQCDYGYSLRYHNGSFSCQPEPGFDAQACPVIHDHTYTVSETGLRLLSGDTCANVSLVIPDTDGRGRSNHPFRHGFPRWAMVTLLLLVGPAFGCSSASSVSILNFHCNREAICICLHVRC